MHPRPFALLLTTLLSGSVAAAPLAAQWMPPSAAARESDLGTSDDALDELLGRIALYPDALLADVLVAATYSGQVDDAARHVRQFGTALLDDQPWDKSVKAVAHYPAALTMLADDDDWRVELGRAYAGDPDAVLAGVQRLRARAVNLGNLRSTPEQAISTDFGNYLITPADPRMLYVPTYDADVVYERPIFTSRFGGARRSTFWSFGAGLLIGSWLSNDCDWRARRVYYDGWTSDFRPAGGWRNRARPFIQISNVYVHPRYRTVVINRDILRVRSRYVYRTRGRDRDRGRFGSAWERDSRDRGRENRDRGRDNRDWQRESRRDERARLDAPSAGGGIVLVNPRRAEHRASEESAPDRPEE